MNEKTSAKTIESLAQDFRQKNGLSTTEPLKVKSLLQKMEVFTVYKPLSKGFSGMSIKIESNERCYRFMLVNSNHAIGKQHFTICHELYHLYFQKDFTKSVFYNSGLFNSRGDKEEYNADMFAGYLLLPEMGVWNMIPEDERGKNKITMGTILSIEHYYGCSHSSLLFRLLKMSLIDNTRKEQLSSGIVNLARQFGYNTSLYEKGNEDEVVGGYGAMAYTAWEKGIISESSYYSLLSDLGVDISKFDEEPRNNGDL